MKDEFGNFSTSQSSEIIGSDSPALRSLIECIESCKPIVSRQFRAKPHRCQNGSKPYLYCETSGASGKPKTIRRRPITWIRSFEVNREMFSLIPSDIYAVFGDLDNSLSLYAALEALHIGADIVHLIQVSPKSQANTLQKCNATVLYATPSRLHKFLSGCKAINIHTFQSMRYLIVGGGKLNELLRNELLEFFPNAQIKEFYGSSETSFVTITDRATPNDSVGRLYPAVNIRIGKKPSGTPMGDEIWINSPYLFDGYEDDVKVRRDGAFISVGDAGLVDDKGYLFLLGRSDRMFTVADNNVYPETIEQVVSSIPGVESCVVVPQYDPKRANVVVAAVQAKDNAVLKNQITQRCRQNLQPFAVPRHYIFVDDMPMLSSGKPDTKIILQHLKLQP